MWCCGRLMKRLYVRETHVERHKGLLGEYKEYKQRYKGYGWICEVCGTVLLDDGEEEYVLVKASVWRKVKEAVLPCTQVIQGGGGGGRGRRC